MTTESSVAAAALAFKSECVDESLEPCPRLGLDCCGLLSSVLECYMTGVICQNEQQEQSGAVANLCQSTDKSLKSAFCALTAPLITPVEYLRRLVRFCSSSRSAFIAAFFYLHKIAAVPDSQLHINSLNIHRLLLTAVLLATKFIDDVHHDNAHFAMVGGLVVEELNALEIHFLKLLQFKLTINFDEMDLFESHVLNSAFVTNDAEYIMLPTRLRNLGYAPTFRTYNPGSQSPTSTIAVPFDESL